MGHQLQRSLFGEHPEPEVSYVTEFLPSPGKWLGFICRNASWNEQFHSRKTMTFGRSYSYPSGTQRNTELPKWLLPIAQAIDSRFGYFPNNCLINYYPNGDHYISFHADQLSEMQAQTGVTIVSLGAVRNMTLRNTAQPEIRHHYPLQAGSAFYMPDEVQNDWQHGILKQAGADARISLSFRKLI
ncbi:MAG: alpha-ketoglutarate-dependent dioxygenase AlkB [Pseudomonadota bacterium]